MEPTLGAPSYSFQYNNQTPNVSATTRTIGSLNFKMSDDDDGITPSAWYMFFANVMNALGLTTGATYPKLISNQIYQ